MVDYPDRLADDRFREWVLCDAACVDHGEQLADPRSREQLLNTIRGTPIFNRPSQAGDVEGVEGLWRRYQAMRRALPVTPDR